MSKTLIQNAQHFYNLSYKSWRLNVTYIQDSYIININYLQIKLIISIKMAYYLLIVIKKTNQMTFILKKNPLNNLLIEIKTKHYNHVQHTF